MKRTFYQVTGRGALAIDHPATGDSKSYRPGAIFQEHPLNVSVVRALRVKRVRQLSEREADSIRAMQAAKRAQVTKGPPPKTVKATNFNTTPIIILDDEAPSADA